MDHRTLVLRREALAELTTADLTRVAGGWTPACHITLDTCLSLDECPTIPLRNCL